MNDSALTNATVREHSLSTSRIRSIDNWSIERDIHGDLRARGIVVKDSFPMPDDIGFRLTITSPIQYREGMVLTTLSNSKYTLLKPSETNDLQLLLSIPEK